MHTLIHSVHVSDSFSINVCSWSCTKLAPASLFFFFFVPFDKKRETVYVRVYASESICVQYVCSLSLLRSPLASFINRTLGAQGDAYYIHHMGIFVISTVAREREKKKEAESERQI